MMKFLKSWRYSGEWKFVVLISGRMIKNPKIPSCSSGAMYWCYYNDSLKEFRINCGHVAITGKCNSRPDDDFFLQYIFHEDFDANLHNSEELKKQREMSETFLNEVEKYNNG